MVNLHIMCVGMEGVGIVLCYFFMNKFKDDHLGEQHDLCISVIFSIYLLHVCYSLHQNFVLFISAVSWTG